MKKSIIALSIACASALAFADDTAAPAGAQWQTPWFTGLTSPTAIGTLGAVNAEWSGLTDANASVENSALVLDLDSNETATITVGGTTAAGDTGTQNKITFTALLTPIAAGDLPTFDENAPQTGFALGYAVSGGDTTYNYYAFNGTEWSTIGDALNELPTDAVSVEINIEYWNETRKATFKVGGVAQGSAVELAVASTVSNISSIDIKGSGTISAIGGDVQLAVAKIGDQKYGTLGEAVTAGGSIEVLRATSENVEITKNGTTIKDDNGLVEGKVSASGDDVKVTVEVAKDNTGAAIGKSGEYTLKTQADSLEKITLTLPGSLSNKEIVNSTIVGGYVKVEIQTAASVITGVTPEGGVAISGAGLAGVRTYLAKYAQTAYEAADVDADKIKDALETTPSGSVNNLKVWQLCAMGIESDTKLNPIANPAGQTESGKIKLSFPGIDKSKINGDYTVAYSYKIGDGQEQPIENPAAFEIPTTTPGICSIKATIGASTN